VSGEWRAYFDSLRGGASDVAHAPVIQSFIELGKHRKVAGAMIDASTMRKQVLVLRLISKFRTLGMFHADLDPLHRQEKRYIPDLDLASYGFTPADLETEFDIGSFLAGPDRMRLADLVAALEETYCRTLGAEYMYIQDTPTKRFIQERLEPIRARPTYSAAQQRHILERLTAAETLERYLHTKYVGQKRFSGEGGLTMIPMLDHLIQRAGAQGVQETVIGMAHRGRLERARQHARQDARRSLLRVRRQARAGVHGRRRQVSPGLLVGRRHARRADAPHPGVQSRRISRS
jgi:2-oxoglutarate dehydrogenase E1 component